MSNSSIGQLRSTQIENYSKIERMNDAFTYEEILINSNVVFEDPYIFLRENDGFSDRKFKSEEEYYITFTIKRDIQSTLNINIAFVNGNVLSKDKQIVKSLELKPGNDEVNFELVVKPRFNEYDKLFFILERTNEDYSLAPRKIEISNCSVNKIINLIYKMEDDIDYITEIGIQAEEGSLFSLNGEGIRIGRSGIYELHFNGIKITQVGAIESLYLKKNNKFIIDYKYVTK